MDNELSNILENTAPKQNGINISPISKDKLENIINDNIIDSEEGSLCDVEMDKKSKNIFSMKAKEKEEKSKEKDEKVKDKDEKNKEKEEKKRKKEEEKKRKDEEKKKRDEEKKKEKELKKKEKEEKKLREKELKGECDSVNSSTKFLNKLLHKKGISGKDKTSSTASLTPSMASKSGDEELESNIDKNKSKSQPLFESKGKEGKGKGKEGKGSNSNVNSIISLLEKNKFGSSHTVESHESLESQDEDLFKNKVKMNIKLFNVAKFNPGSPNPNIKGKKENKDRIQSAMPVLNPNQSSAIHKTHSDQNINDQSNSSNNGLLVSKKMSALPKRRPPTKQKLMENAENAFSRSGNDSRKMVHSTFEFLDIDRKLSFSDFKLDFMEFSDDKTDSPKKESPKKDNAKKDNAKKDNAKKDNAKKDNAKKENSKKDNVKKDNVKKEVKISKENVNESEDDDKSFDESDDNGNILDLKQKLTKKLISKQKFSDKLYPGGENCDSSIAETKSIFVSSEFLNDSLGSRNVLF